MGKKDDEIVNLQNQIANFSAQYNRLLERLKEVNAINKQWESQYNDVKVTAEATIREKNQECIRLTDELSRTDARVKFLEQELEMAKEMISEMEKEAENSKKIFAIVTETEDIIIPKKAEVGGRLKTTSNIKIGEGAVVHGDIEGNNILVGPSTIVIGIIIAKGILTVGRKTEIASDIAVGGEATFESDCKVRKIVSGGKIIIGEKCRVDKISSGGNVELKQGVVVKEGIEYVGSLNIGEHVSIGGNIKRKTTGHSPAFTLPTSDNEEEVVTETSEPEEVVQEEEIEIEVPIKEVPKPQPLVAKKSCSKCGAVMGEHENFCPNCGAAATKKEKAPAPAQHVQSTSHPISSKATRKK